MTIALGSGVEEDHREAPGGGLRRSSWREEGTGMAMRKAVSTMALAGLLAAGGLMAAPAAQASTSVTTGYVYVGMYPSGAACDAAGRAYVARGEAVSYFCDVAPNTARLSIWA
ncbi:hypothetical protein ACIOGZ_30990 [Kitasatospora sp. NPDC088160]|uniref:hypothetical protein n=2 Tax=Kitasatospora TaxID=2063 RepID=UPI00380EFBB3